MAHLREAPHLTLLNVHSRGVTSAGLANLQFLAQLRRLRLELENYHPTDADLQCVEPLSQLEELTLIGDITDAGLLRLRRLTKLKYLNVRHTLVTQDGVEDLQHALPRCMIDWDPDWHLRPR
jgi:hypothetical protein